MPENVERYGDSNLDFLEIEEEEPAKLKPKEAAKTKESGG